MANDKDSDDSKVVLLREAGERLDQQAFDEILKVVDEANQQLFRHRLEMIAGSIRVRPGPLGFVPIEGIAAGHLDVAMRDLNRVKLPVRYRAAVAALRAVAYVDEAANVADRAAGLATYARQAGDNELLSLAVRIRMRAIRRCGELLREIEAARGRRTDLKLRDGADPRLTRGQAAADAGLSERRAKTSLRIAAVPEADFEAAVERERPPTLTELAGLTRPAVPRRRWTAPETETTFVRVELPYRPAGTLEEVRTQRELATLMAVWRDAGLEARKRFLQAIGR